MLYYRGETLFHTNISHQHLICSMSPTSSGRANQPFTHSTSPCASIWRSNHEFRFSTRDVAYSSILQRYCPTRSPTTALPVCLAFSLPSLPANPILDQTWIIIVLIIISIIVTISEVFLRFALLHASQGPAGTPASILARVMGRSITPSPSEWYSAANAPPGCICPSLGPAGAGLDMGGSEW